MTKPLDFSKYRKGLTKSIPGISAGFNDPKIWISTGNYCLNYLISGDFKKGVPLSKVCCIAGETGSGKSYIAAGNLIKNAQEQGVFCVILDSENALDESWLHALGVDTSPEKLMRFGVSMVDEVAKTVYEFMKEYKNEIDPPPVLFIVDSLGMLTTPTDQDQFQKGDMKGDLGRKAKSVTALVRNVVNLISNHDVGFVATNHTYASQDMFDPDDKISGGQGFIYASTIVVATKKKKLRDKEMKGGTTSEILGIKAACKVVKSRYAKPFESVDIFIPYESGMDPYSGLFDLFDKSGLFTRQGNRYKYVSRTTGEEILDFEKGWKASPEKLDVVMAEFTADDLIVAEVELEDEGET